MIAIIILLIILIVLFIGLMIFLNYVAIKHKQNSILGMEEILDKKLFHTYKLLYVNKKLILAVNKQNTKLAIIKGFGYDILKNYTYEEIALSFVVSTDKNLLNLKLNYIKNAQLETIYIDNVSKEAKDFIYYVMKNALLNKLDLKYPQENFNLITASDWNCNYLWAYNEKNANFAYYKNCEKPVVYKINLLKEHFTLDVKYSYFCAPIMGILQQIFIFEKEFLDELFSNILRLIKLKTSKISSSIYFDSFNNIVYLTNDISSIQSVILEKIEEVVYKDNKITFELKNEDKTISYLCDPKTIESFKEFITNINLKQVAYNFNYSSDKLINISKNTKFIIDITRNRLVYCANLEHINKFSFLTIAFENIKNVELRKSGLNSFVRIYLKDKNMLDVTCQKYEVAQYIFAQIKILISNQ